MTWDTARRIAGALRSLAPTWVSTGVRVIDVTDVDDLRPGERAVVAGAVDQRQAEFATGRALLRQLIGDHIEIGVGPDRRPLLPLGVIGTLAHDREYAVAAATTRTTCGALGIDIEPFAVFTPEEARTILCHDERHIDPHLAFVLKEAVYKAWSWSGGRLLDHDEVVLDVDESRQRFTAVVRAGPATFAGRYVEVEGRRLALVITEGTGTPVDPWRP
jgi:4'-phosphopantetheinyl transferase EntD